LIDCLDILGHSWTFLDILALWIVGTG